MEKTKRYIEKVGFVIGRLTERLQMHDERVDSALERGDQTGDRLPRRVGKRHGHIGSLKRIHFHPVHEDFGGRGRSVADLEARVPGEKIHRKLGTEIVMR